MKVAGLGYIRFQAFQSTLYHLIEMVSMAVTNTHNKTNINVNTAI